MNACMLLSAGLLLGAGPSEPAGPSVAVLALEAKGGVQADTADLLSTVFTTMLRDDGRFVRVVSSKEMDSMLGFERQRQLLACTSTSCMAELAGALGVDFVIMGSVGRIGSEVWLLNISMSNTHTAVVVASVVKSIQGGTEAGLLKALPAATAELLQKAGVPPKGTKPATAATPAPAPATSPATTPEVATSSPAPATAIAPASESSGRSLGSKLAMAGGGVGLAVGVLGGLVGLVGLAGAAGVWGLSFAVPSLGLGVPGRGILMFAGYYGLWALGVVSLVVGAGLGLVGAGTLGGGAFLG